MRQAKVKDGLAFDLFTFERDRIASIEADVVCSVGLSPRNICRGEPDCPLLKVAEPD